MYYYIIRLQADFSFMKREIDVTETPSERSKRRMTPDDARSEESR